MVSTTSSYLSLIEPTRPRAVAANDNSSCSLGWHVPVRGTRLEHGGR